MRLTITIKVQSISDIITNSSSELFCTITSDNFEEDIKSLLRRLFKSDNCDLEPSISCYDNAIEVWIPYDYADLSEFFKEGIVAILDKYFKDMYKINWDEY